MLWPFLIASACLSASPLHERFDAAQAWKYNTQVAGFGERWPGSAGHASTAALIERVLLADGVAVDADDFTALTPRGPIPVHTIVGKFGATGDSRQPIFILAGHYDTLFQPGFTGANDGGSSTAILLAFADALAHQKTNLQVWLVWTDLEEAVQSFTADDGLYGSRHLAAKLKANGSAARVTGFFLLDMIADKDLGIARESGSDPVLQSAIAAAAAQLGYGNRFFGYEAGIVDDHVPFIEAGVAAVDIVDAQYGRMGPQFDGMGEFHHSNLDTLERISQNSLEIVGRTVMLTLELLDARQPSRPASLPSRPRQR